MKESAELLISALRAAASGASMVMPSTFDWEKVLTLTKAHKVLALLYTGLGKDVDIPQDKREFLLREYRQTIFRSIQLEECRRKIEECLRDADVDYVFLKGSVLKDFYPVPELRTMTDIDLLVHTEDYDAITSAFLSVGAELDSRDGNHLNFRFPGALLVECHPNLVHPSAPYGTGLNPGWQYCSRGEDGRWKMTTDGLYLHTLCHLAEHFLEGGVGVRFVLDIWLLRKAKADELNEAFLEQELQRMQLKEFADNIVALGDLWFAGEKTGKDLSELEDYILSSGIYGFAERADLNAVSLTDGKRSAAIKRVLYSREELENRYPWSRKSVLLLPAAWCARAFYVVTKRGPLLERWLRNTNRVSKRDIAAQREKLSRFGINPKA